MVRIEIRNFQSIAHEIVEVQGFTALVGRSNIGKSAVVRAVKAALTGAPADAYVRHQSGCPRITKAAKSCHCFCSVSIVSPGFDLLWEKGDTVNRYVFNNATYTAVSRGTPDFLLKECSLVKLGDDKELLQVADQFNPIFILNRSGTVVADVLSDVVKLDQINVAIRAVEKDRKEVVATRKVREDDVVSLELSVAAYKGLDEAVVRVRQVESKETLVQETEKKLAELTAFLDSLIDVVVRVKVLVTVDSVVVPQVQPVLDLSETLAAVSRLVGSLTDRLMLVSQLSSVEKIDIPQLDSFLVSGGAYANLVSWNEKLEHFRTFFNVAKKIEDVSLSPFDPTTEQLKLHGSLCSWVDDIESTVLSVTQLNQNVTLATEAETKILEEFQALGICPTCNRDFHGVVAHV